MAKQRLSRKSYDNQSGIEDEIRIYLLKTYFNNPFVRRIYLYGSLYDGQFGIYDKPKKPLVGDIKLGSDVDLVIIADERYPIPNNWPAKEDYIFELYEFCNLTGIKGIKDGIHGVSVFVYRASLSDLPVANRHKLKGDVFDTKTRREALELFLREHPHKIWYEKD